jgi:hypothetical protein
MPMTTKITNPKVFIQGPHDILYVRLWREAGFIGVRDIREADVVCFTGGEDVDPQLYGEVALQSTHFNAMRDKRDCEAWALAEDKFKVGICRGGQFLNVMNGGKLWQDINHHVGGHKVYDRHTKQEIYCSSTHHQQMIPSKDKHLVVGIASIATEKKSANISWMCVRSSKSNSDSQNLTDYEVLWYPETGSLCFQPHPEFGMDDAKYAPCADYFIHLLDRFFIRP